VTAPRAEQSPTAQKPFTMLAKQSCKCSAGSSNCSPGLGNPIWAVGASQLIYWVQEGQPASHSKLTATAT
jgi:hypothetical protein